MDRQTDRQHVSIKYEKQIKKAAKLFRNEKISKTVSCSFALRELRTSMFYKSKIRIKIGSFGLKGVNLESQNKHFTHVLN